MPKKDETHLDTGNMGLALGLCTPGHHHKAGPQATDLTKLYKVYFDTGVVMFVPEPIFLNMKFHLREKD